MIAVIHWLKWWASRLHRSYQLWRRERLFWAIYQMSNQDWCEYRAREDAAEHAWEFLRKTHQLTWKQRADDRAAWEIGRRLRQLHLETAPGGRQRPRP